MHKEPTHDGEHKSSRIRQLKEIIRPLAPMNIARSAILCAAIAMQLLSFTSCGNDSITYQSSGNWAGYITEQKGHDVVQVQGTFTIPTVTKGCDAFMSPPKDSGMLPKSAIWVGIGGVDEASLVQVGVIATYGKITYRKVNNSDASIFKESIRPVATYYGFYETLPYASVKIPQLAVRPGDKMLASVRKVLGTNDSFVVSLKDLSRNEKPFSLTLNSPIGDGYGVPHMSAEWIVEKVSTNTSPNAPQYPLAGFSDIQFRNSGFKTSISPPGDSVSVQNRIADGEVTNIHIFGIDALHKNYDLATPSSLLQGGSGFNVYDSKCTPSGN